jgi:hypothetical protein
MLGVEYEYAVVLVSTAPMSQKRLTIRVRVPYAVPFWTMGAHACAQAESAFPRMRAESAACLGFVPHA